MKQVVIYTDGSCDCADGSGGVGIVLVCDDYRKEIAKGFSDTKTGAMEVMAVVMALQALRKPCSVVLHCDSQYVTNTITKGWARRWMAKNWGVKLDDGTMVTRPNADMWEIVLKLLEVHRVEAVWIKGKRPGLHTEHDRCHEIANEARKKLLKESSCTSQAFA